MEETKKKGWIKNFLIVFLALMLLLTLFSNTIMNRSLPEVSVQYAESGTISTQVAVSGSIITGGMRTVSAEDARQIKEVLVRRGETVTRGQVLATLVPGEETDTFDLEMELKSLEIEYKRMLLAQPDELIGYHRTIADAEEEIAKLDAYLADYPALAARKEAAEKRIDVLDLQIEKAKEQKDALDDEIAELQKKKSEYSSMYDNMTALKKAIEDLDDQIDDAEKLRSSASKEKNRAQTAYNNANRLAQLAESAYTEAAETLDTLNTEWETMTERYGTLSDKAERTPEEETEFTELPGKISAKKAEIRAQEPIVEAALKEYNEKAGLASSAYQTYTTASSEYTSAQSSVKALNKQKDDLDENFDALLIQSSIDEKEDQKDALDKEIKGYNKEKEAAQKELDEVNADITREPEDVETEKRTLTRSIEDAQSALDLAAANGEIENETDALELVRKEKEISRKRAEIAKARQKTENNTVLAPTDGEVTLVSIADGDKVDAGSPLFELTMADAGHTMECSVTNAQAARLYVGQEATVQYWYWGVAPSVYISQIRSDTASGGKNKLITFEVSGDVSEGSELHLLVGGQSAYYNTVVPNSAIHEDSDGKFILLVRAKDSPLGNRYYAERMDVNVQVSDATRSAIDASLSWGDYIITKASVPIADGQQVRLAEK